MLRTNSTGSGGDSRLFWSVLCGVALTTLLISPCFAGRFYVDCADGDDGAAGTSGPQAWRSLNRVNSETFHPGDEILMRRGTTCHGMFAAAGSGADGAPIVLGAYDVGPRPVIDAGMTPAAIRLFNQEHWHIRSIETTGGDPFGVHISGDVDGVLNHFRIVDVEVHDVGGTITNKESGLIVVTPGSAGTTFNDVIIDGALAYQTTQWAGILVGGDDFWTSAASPRSTNVIVRNSRVHDVYGDGIVLYQVNNGLIETSVAHDTGLNPSDAVGTPNGIWTWMCGNCVVQFNEGYRTNSPGVDGGVFDIDYGCSDNVVQYNYAHDVSGYCVSVFGAYGPTTNSIVRYNVCANNGQDPAKAYQGEIYMVTWAGGTIDGVQIYNNTVVWNPPVSAYAVNVKWAALVGNSPRILKNNIFHSSVPELVEIGGAPLLDFDHNIYWSTSGDPLFKDPSGTTSFATWQSGGRDVSSMRVDPMLADPQRMNGGPISGAYALRFRSPAIDAGTDLEEMGSHDFMGRLIPMGQAPDIGALETLPRNQKPRPQGTDSRWRGRLRPFLKDR